MLSILLDEAHTGHYKCQSPDSKVGFARCGVTEVEEVAHFVKTLSLSPITFFDENLGRERLPMGSV